MARANVRGRFAFGLTLGLGVACNKAEPPSAEGELRSPSVEQPRAEPPAAVADPCHALAQLYCENGPVECASLEQTLREAEVPAPACAKAVEELEAMIASLSGPERDLLPMVMARYLPTVMLESPKLSPEQRAKLEALADGPLSP